MSLSVWGAWIETASFTQAKSEVFVALRMGSVD